MALDLSPFADQTDYDIAVPRADAMIQSLRAFGYDLPTAVADLIDNSIFAGAKNIWLEFFWNGASSTIAMVDDGMGMTEHTLVNAMRLGSTSPLDIRTPQDLGRFGLGLKTASFSQCKKLTVGSRQNSGGECVRCWDLEYVTQCGEWRLRKEGSDNFAKLFGRLNDKVSGTVVLWEDMDRLVDGNDVQSQEHQDHFFHQAEQVRQHIAMVFHRFIDKPKSLKIFLNGYPIKAWDPFLSDETATQILVEEAHVLLGNKITVRPYVLPHHSKINPQLYELAAGPHGWNAQQGFYVYRNQRLLVAGDWLNLPGLRKEEHYKLARVLIDIPNSLDAEWKIDVKKSRATPPAVLRNRLLQIAKATRQKASGIYRYRGTNLTQGGSEVVPLWNKKVLHGQISYKISREHPLVKNLLEISPVVKRKTEALLGLIEELVPVPLITIDASESPDKHSKPFEGKDESLILSILRETYESLLFGGMSRNQARLYLSKLEPFQHYPHLLVSIDEEPHGDKI